MTPERLAVFFDDAVLAVRTPDGLFDQAPSPLLDYQLPSVEGPDRIANIRSILKRGPMAGDIDWQPGRAATDAEILLFHTAPYLATVKEWDKEGAWATSTTYLPKGGLAAVRIAAGCAVDAVRHVLAGKARRSYALVRPPGHHAAPAVADGYCFVNAVGVAALDALSRGCRRVAVVDWDVHHGNGTQEGFYDRADVLTISIHMDHGPWGESHPQTGGVDEVGRGAGKGYNINLPLPMGCGDDTYIHLMETCVLPALDRFKPDLIIVANGQDAGQFDPNGRQLVSMRGFHRLAGLLRDAADRLCEGRLVAIQEGGYNPAHAAFSAYAIAAGLIGRALDIKDPLAFYPEDGPLAKTIVAALVQRHPLTPQWFAKTETA